MGEMSGSRGFNIQTEWLHVEFPLISVNFAAITGMVYILCIPTVFFESKDGIR